MPSDPAPAPGPVTTINQTTAALHALAAQLPSAGEPSIHVAMNDGHNRQTSTHAGVQGNPHVEAAYDRSTTGAAPARHVDSELVPITTPDLRRRVYGGLPRPAIPAGPSSPASPP